MSNIGKIDHVLPKYASKMFGVPKFMDKNNQKRVKVKGRKVSKSID